METSNILPKKYDLFFDVDLEKFKFSGKEDIDLKLSESTNKIVLNSKNLDISKAGIVDGKGIVNALSISADNGEETLTLTFDREFEGNQVLHIEFEGVLNDDLMGFYRSKYIYKKKEMYLATTQFEASYARRAFPCFDEPARKAEFKVSFRINKDLAAVSNMPVKSEKIRGKKKIVEFDETPLMSTYLLYFGIGDFDFVEEAYEDRVSIGVITTPGKKSQGKFALDLTKKFLKYFEEYTGINYPLPKLDIIAIPDFAAGAMENWGAITFREVLILASKDSSFKIKRRIAEVIAHELWHQWSGNLVTMKWWNDLWLNESFASYMAFKAVNHYFPEWRLWEYYLETETFGAMKHDSLKTTHPISVEVNSPKEIEEIFDSISYGKGGSVLRMLDSFLGEEVFREGVSNYLKEFEYKNASSEDFWSHLAKVSKYPVKKIADSWINQPGYPLLRVWQRGKKIVIEQEAFQEQFRKQKWIVPIEIKTKNGVEKVLLKRRRQKFKLGSEFLKINNNQSGFFRVKYLLDDLNRIGEGIKNKEFSNMDRFGVENDLFNLALYGKISVDHYLNFLKNYVKEDDALVLADIYGNFLDIEFALFSSDSWNEVSDKFKKYFEPTFRNHFKNLGWEPRKNEPVNDLLLRPLAISFMSFSGNKNAVSEGKKRFDKHHPDVRAAIYGLYASNGSEKEHEKILDKYLKTNNIEEKLLLLTALYRFKEEEVIKKSLELIKSENIRLQDKIYAFGNISSNPHFRSLFFDYAISNWEFFEQYKDVFFVFSRLLRAMIVNSRSLREVSNFIKGKNFEYKKTIADSFETALIYDNFFKKNFRVILSYFSRN